MIEELKTRIGTGARVYGFWSDDDILGLAQYNPQLALAKKLRTPFAPYCLNIVNTFNDTVNTTSQPQTFQGTSSSTTANITQPTLIDGVMFQVDVPSAFAGSIEKSISDFFFGLQSGIQCTMDVVGARASAQYYTVAPFYTPIRSLCAMLNEAWPCGWAIDHNQTVKMSFQQSFALPFTPATITVTFRMWQPYGAAGIDFQQMTSPEALDRLSKLGLDTSSIPGGKPAMPR